MTLKKCDRCGAFYEFVPASKTNATYKLMKKYPDNPNKLVVDLCPVCLEKLRIWFDECEG